MSSTLEEIVRGWNLSRRMTFDVGVAKGPWGSRYFVEAMGVGLFACTIPVADRNRTLALTGYIQQALDVVSGLPFTVKGSARLLEVKILLLVVIFTYAFFKFSWAMRQLGQAATLIGAAPAKPTGSAEQHAPVINRIARIASYAGTNFNNGLRAYYFGLAALAWFLHPWLMIVTTAWVIYVLYAREFRSKTLNALIEDDASDRLRT